MKPWEKPGYRPILAAVVMTLAAALPATALAQTAPKSPVEAANLYLDAYLRAKPDAVEALGRYLDPAEGETDEAEVADIPQTLSEVLHDAIAQETSGPAKERDASVDTVASAILAALKRVTCRAIPGEPDEQDDHAVAVPFACSVPDTQAALAYMGEDVLKGGKARPAQHLAAADAINAVTTMQKVLGTLHLHSVDGTTWTSTDPSEVSQAIVLGIMSPPES